MVLNNGNILIPNRVKNILKTFISIVLYLALCGCTKVGEDFIKPKDVVTPTYRHNNADTTISSLPDDWWLIYGDESLNLLEKQAFKDNPGLKASAQRLLQSHELLGGAKAGSSPTVNLNASSQKLRSSLESQQSIVFGRQLIYGNNFAVGASMSYELDIWGRLKRVVESAEALVEASEYEHVGVALVLSTQVASLYWTLRGAVIDRNILEQGLSTRTETLKIVRARYKAGFSNELDVFKAEIEESNILAEIYELQRQQNLIEHALAALIGESPSLSLPSIAIGDLPPAPSIPSGLPADLLSHRPDLASSISNLRAANARIGVAKAAFFPTLLLTSDFGYASRNLRSLADADSRQFNIGPLALSLPLFDGGRNRKKLLVEKSKYDEALLSHKEKLLNALREVEDALSNVEFKEKQSRVRKLTRQTAIDAYQVSLFRYERGLTGYLDVLDAQRNSLGTDRLAAQSHIDQLVASVALVRALGGGWTTKPKEEISANIEEFK